MQANAVQTTHHEKTLSSLLKWARKSPFKLVLISEGHVCFFYLKLHSVSFSVLMSLLLRGAAREIHTVCSGL